MIVISSLQESHAAKRIPENRLYFWNTISLHTLSRHRAAYYTMVEVSHLFFVLL